MDYQGGWWSFAICLLSCFSEPPSLGDDDGGDGGTTAAATSTSAGTSATGATATAASMPTRATDGSTGASSTTVADESTTGGEPTSSTGASPSECAGRSHVAFINFDGVRITEGPADDAPSDVSSLPETAGVWAPYRGNDRRMIVDTVVAAFTPFDICITDTRPPSGDYDMMVITAGAHNSGALAFGPQDCNDENGGRDVAFTFAPLIAYGPAAKGFVIASLIANTVGLGVVTGAPDDIMKVGIETNDADLSFTRTCHALDAGAFCPPVTCTGQSQSSSDHLFATLGPAP